MCIQDKIRELISEGEKVIKISGKNSLYDKPYYDGEDYQKWISKCSIFMEMNFRNSEQYKEFLEASKSALGNGKEYYDKMIGILKAINETMDWGILQNLNNEKKRKIFISHSSMNTNITDKFVDLLKLMGVKREQIYYSSYEETGVGFLEDCLNKIRDEFNNSDLMVIFMLSREFYNSKVCIAETGATWVSAMNNYIPITIPPYSYNNISGVIRTTQAAVDLGDIKNISSKLEKLKESIEEFLMIDEKANSAEWTRNKEKFIEFIKNNTDTLDRIQGELIGVSLNKNNLNTDLMLRIKLINNTQSRMKLEEVEIRLKVNNEIKEIILDDWSVTQLVLQPLEEAIVYLKVNLDEQIKRSEIKLEESEIKISAYNEN